MAVGWVVFAYRSLSLIAKEFPQAFALAFITVFFIVCYSLWGKLAAPPEPLGQNTDEYIVWQARSTAAYTRTMVAILIVTVFYTVTTFGILWKILEREQLERQQKNEKIQTSQNF
jgi:hypothetical protein